MKKESTSNILCYIPRSMRKERQSPFLKVDTLKGFTMPLTAIVSFKQTKSIFRGLVRPMEGVKVEHDQLPNWKTEEGFDPNAYTLLAKARYNSQSKGELGTLPMAAVDPKALGSDKVPKNSRVGLGYVQPSPVRTVTFLLKMKNHM